MYIIKRAHSFYEALLVKFGLISGEEQEKKTQAPIVTLLRPITLPTPIYTVKQKPLRSPFIETDL